MKVQLVYFSSCPNVESARAGLRNALVACGMPATFEEIDVESDRREQYRQWGSPTILVDGRDLFDATQTGCSCRIYPDAAATSVGAPSEASIADALRLRTEKRSLLRSLLVLPGVILPLLPAATCPFCIAAYAGVVSALGLGFLLNERILIPLIVVFLGVSVATVVWTSRSHRRRGPLAATISGASAVVVGRVFLGIPILVYAGVALLIVGTAWNLWLKRPRQRPLVQLGRSRSNVV